MALQLGGVDGLGAAYNLCYVVLINWEANGRFDPLWDLCKGRGRVGGL